MAEVVLNGIGKRFGATEVIRDLTLSVRDGELFALLGPSGSGKSTLLHLIAGLEAPSSGCILFDGRDVTALQPRERDIALVFQSYALYPHMTVADNLAFPLRVAKRGTHADRRTIQQAVKRVADSLGLGSVLERRPGELSGGQRQRVALGRAIIRQPAVFLLDEPLSNLDVQLRANMRAELRRLHEQLKITMIYVTHDQIEALAVADRVAVLDRGRLQQVGTPAELYQTPANLFVATFIGHPAMNLLEAHVADGAVTSGPIRIPLPTTQAESLRSRNTQSVTLGLRPEQIRVTAWEAGARADEDRLAATVREIESTGAQTWVTCELAAPNVPVIVGLAEEALRIKPGATAALSFRAARPHLFDPMTGLRLGEEAS
jgi:multiple sugar transport system ATP-binding protein